MTADRRRLCSTQRVQGSGSEQFSWPACCQCQEIQDWLHTGAQHQPHSILTVGGGILGVHSVSFIHRYVNVMLSYKFFVSFVQFVCEENCSSRAETRETRVRFASKKQRSCHPSEAAGTDFCGVKY